MSIAFNSMSVTGNLARVLVGGMETKVKSVEMSMRKKKVVPVDKTLKKVSSEEEQRNREVLEGKYGIEGEFFMLVFRMGNSRACLQTIKKQIERKKLMYNREMKQQKGIILDKVTRIKITIWQID